MKFPILVKFEHYQWLSILRLEDGRRNSEMRWVISKLVESGIHPFPHRGANPGSL